MFQPHRVILVPQLELLMRGAPFPHTDQHTDQPS